MISIHTFQAAAATSFDLTITVGAHGSPASAGPKQTTSLANCRPGTWSIVYTNGYPAGFGGPFGSVSTELRAIVSFPTISGFVFPFADFLSSGSMNILKTYVCDVLPVTFEITCPYTTFYNGLTIRAVGTWQTSCG
jgi:hypothetical protein